MKTEDLDKYVILRDDKDNIADFATYLENIVPKHYEDKHLVIDLLKYDQMALTELLHFLKLSNYHRATKHSFVIVNAAMDVDDVPMEMIVVPTLQEAGDIVEMEEIERDLGF